MQHAYASQHKAKNVEPDILHNLQNRTDCVELGQKEGFVLFRCLQANDETGMLEPAGDIEFETQFPNTLL